MRHKKTRNANSRKGQAMVETIIVMLFMCLIFFLAYEYTNLLTARTVLDYAAARAVRARAVGFNDFMIDKTVRVATMSVAGKCETADAGGKSLSTGALVSRMGSYLEADNESEVRGILDFELWRPGRLGWDCAESAGDLKMHVWQRRPYYSFDGESDTDLHKIEGAAEIEAHAPFYLQ